MKPLVIQLLGQARSGKDWTASQLKAYFESQGKSVEIYSYAAPMKQIAATLFDITLEQLDNYKNHPLEYVIDITQLSDFKVPVDIHNTNFRRFLQLLGNDAIKPIFGDTVWANLATKHIAKSTADIIIIPDCRFTVELNEVGGTTVRILNDSLPPPMDHPSELELLNYTADYSLDNTDYRLTEDEIGDLAKRIFHDRERAPKVIHKNLYTSAYTDLIKYGLTEDQASSEAKAYRIKRTMSDSTQWVSESIHNKNKGLLCK